MGRTVFYSTDVEVLNVPIVLSVYMVIPNGLIKEFVMRPAKWRAEDPKWENKSSISLNMCYKKDDIAIAIHALQFQGIDIKKHGK